MRNRFAETFYELAKEDSRLCMVVADISPAGSMEKFRRDFPKRFVNTGVAEQAMIGLVAGMALRGLRPFAYTIATFALYRPFEMIRDDLAYQGLPVTVVGIGCGVTYSTLGGTHHAMEDVAVASAIPTMSVISPCDPLEVAEATRFCARRENGGPLYLRLGKAGEPTFTADARDPWTFGRLRYLRRGTDDCVITYGPTMKLASEVAGRLQREGTSVSLVSCHTIKPLDRDGVLDALGTHRRIIVLEETTPLAGLGAQIKQIAWDGRARCAVHAFALKDEFIHLYGSHDQLLAAHGLTADAVMAALAADGGRS